MKRLSQSEYLVLRQTIARRGGLRPILAWGGFAAWAAVITAVLVTLPYPVAAVIPLLLLVATFEVIRPMHFGVERIGRYVQVFYEERGDAARALADTPSWERVAMRFGSVPGTGGHPLFVPLFFLATIANFTAVIIPAPVSVELAVMAVPHAAFLVWLVAADRAMRRQRDIELARMRELFGERTS